ncbi:uncharacterized protein LOC108052535 [Drosophila rhopaloa]|uniref:Uncharacterized protein n=1 Tax=Drosophila rhopaloa TaxID=1041015 RepID=A0ABM5I5G1_DRORH|nr:uncharacterized protein LOC108052535 [Drosophila rhopaloa]
MNMRGSVAVRSMFLDCLRENAANMRLEHEDLGRRIAISLANSRKTLANIESMNLELQKMKETIHNALNNIQKDATYENKSCRMLLRILVIVVNEFDLEAELDPKIVTRMFIDKSFQPALEETLKPVDDSNVDHNGRTVCSQNNIDMAEFHDGPKPRDASEDNSNLVDMEIIESVNESMSHINFQ